MKTFLTVLMIASFSGSMAMAELGLNDINESGFFSQNSDSELKIGGEISFKSPSVKIESTVAIDSAGHLGTETFTVYKLVNLEIAKKAFMTAPTDEEKIEVILSASRKSTTLENSGTFTTFVRPIHRAELMSLYRRLSGGKEAPASILVKYQEMLKQNGIAPTDEKKLGFNLDYNDAELSFDSQTLRHFFQLLENKQGSWLFTKNLNPESIGVDLFGKTNPEILKAAQDVLSRRTLGTY